MRRVLCVIAVTFGCAAAQGYIEEKHQNRVHTEVGHLNEIPKRFELKGKNAVSEFEKYVHDISDLTQKANTTVKYKVKVEILKPRTVKSKKSNKLIHSKKYKIPLKKKSMMLSSFEVIQRKLVEEKHKAKMHVDKIVFTTPKIVPILTTKPAHLGKYKPIISKVKGNFTKVPVRPVRNKIITLTR